MAVVVGIFPGSDPDELQRALGAGPLDMSKVRVITNAAPSKAHEDAPFDFVHVVEAQQSNSLSDDMTRGTGIMSDAGGTGLPESTQRAMLSAFLHPIAANYLSDNGIPEDEVDNYNDAIASGRTIILYEAIQDVQSAAEFLKKAGLKNVHVYS